jgi:hypothetical protein
LENKDLIAALKALRHPKALHQQESADQKGPRYPKRLGRRSAAPPKKLSDPQKGCINQEALRRPNAKLPSGIAVLITLITRNSDPDHAPACGK